MLIDMRLIRKCFFWFGSIGIGHYWSQSWDLNIYYFFSAFISKCKDSEYWKATDSEECYVSLALDLLNSSKYYIVKMKARGYVFSRGWDYFFRPSAYPNLLCICFDREVFFLSIFFQLLVELKAHVLGISWFWPCYRVPFWGLLLYSSFDGWGWIGTTF